MRHVPKLAALITLLLVGCAAPVSDEPVPPGIAPVDDDDSAAAADDDDAAPMYDGPAYRPCVSDAQCDPGSACTTVPGYGGTFCAPPCDPGGDSSECALPGLPYATTCLASGRCGRACDPDEQIVPDRFNGPKEPPPSDHACPDPLTCRDVDGDALCAGAPSGQAGYYGTCSHPMVEGSDCPTESACYGGSFIGTDEAGICLPHCDSGLCPVPDNASGVSTICYDIGFDHPVCALLCDPNSSVCPAGQFCFDIGFAGICAPEGAENPF